LTGHVTRLIGSQIHHEMGDVDRFDIGDQHGLKVGERQLGMLLDDRFRSLCVVRAMIQSYVSRPANSRQLAQ
jgi:hypothetical protein